MRHRKGNRKLSRHSEHRKALFMNLCISLLLHGKIKTTVAKAKELRRVIEPLITRAKEDSVHNRRISFAKLRSKEIIKKLFNIVGPFYKSHKPNGGYTRILKCGFRSGDAAPMAIIELVDHADFVVEEAK